MQDSPFNTSPSIIIAAVSAIILSLVGIIAITNEIRAVNSTTSEPEARGEESIIESKITPFVLEKLASAQKAELARHCANCGVIDSITMYEVKKNLSNTIISNTIIHQVKVRMDNGTYRVVSQQDQPIFHVGDKVKIVNGEVVQLVKAKTAEDNGKTADNNGKFAVMLTTFTSRLF